MSNTSEAFASDALELRKCRKDRMSWTFSPLPNEHDGGHVMTFSDNIFMTSEQIRARCDMSQFDMYAIDALLAESAESYCTHHNWLESHNWSLKAMDFLRSNDRASEPWHSPLLRVAEMISVHRLTGKEAG